MDRRMDGQMEKVKPVFPIFNFAEARGKIASLRIWYGCNYTFISTSTLSEDCPDATHIECHPRNIFTLVVCCCVLLWPSTGNYDTHQGYTYNCPSSEATINGMGKCTKLIEKNVDIPKHNKAKQKDAFILWDPSYQWFSARLLSLQCVSNGVIIAVLHWAIDIHWVIDTRWRFQHEERINSLAPVRCGINFQNSINMFKLVTHNT